MQYSPQGCVSSSDVEKEELSDVKEAHKEKLKQEEMKNILCYNPFSLFHAKRALFSNNVLCTPPFSLTHTLSPPFSSYLPSTPASHSMPLELYLTGRKGFVLHGNSAVGSQDSDAQLPLPVQGLLVPLLHQNRLKSRDHRHLEIQKNVWYN